METQREENLIRRIFKNEITWVFFLISGIWGFVVTVILPLNNLQYSEHQTQVDIAEIKMTIQQYVSNYNDLNLRLTRVESEMNIPPNISRVPN